MENERNSTNVPETSLEQGDYNKEYWYLNQLKWKLDFRFCQNPALCESNLYSSIAWYIDTIKKEGWEREEKIQSFINSIINLDASDSEKLLYVDKILIKEKQKWYNKEKMDYDVKLLESILSRIDNMYKREKGHLPIVTWIKPFMIPERYYWRFTESWIEWRVIDENRKNFINSIKEQRKKIDELEKKL